MLKSSTIVACVLTAGISGFNSAAAQSCPPAQVHLQGDDEFLIQEHSGRLVWLREGPNSSTYRLLDDCNTIYVSRRQIIYFKLNNMFKAKASDGAASFVAVQIARLQSGDQRADVVIERNDGWSRNSSDQPGFGPIEVRGLRPSGFFQIHDKEPFDDKPLRLKDWWWHATPNGGNFSSFGDPTKWSWDLDLFSKIPNRTLLSNRLFKFDINPSGNTGIEFEVGIRGTEVINIKIFSPFWTEVNNYTLTVRRD